MNFRLWFPVQHSRIQFHFIVSCVLHNAFWVGCSWPQSFTVLLSCDDSHSKICWCTFPFKSVLFLLKQTTSDRQRSFTNMIRTRPLVLCGKNDKDRHGAHQAWLLGSWRAWNCFEVGTCYRTCSVMAPRYCHVLWRWTHCKENRLWKKKRQQNQWFC